MRGCKAFRKGTAIANTAYWLSQTSRRPSACWTCTSSVSGGMAVRVQGYQCPLTSQRPPACKMIFAGCSTVCTGPCCMSAWEFALDWAVRSFENYFKGSPHRKRWSPRFSQAQSFRVWLWWPAWIALQQSPQLWVSRSSTLQDNKIYFKASKTLPCWEKGDIRGQIIYTHTHTQVKVKYCFHPPLCSSFDCNPFQSCRFHWWGSWNDLGLIIDCYKHDIL